MVDRARTIAVGDIHGDLAALESLLSKLPALHPRDTLVFLGDYCDRGPDSRQVIARIRALEASAAHRVVVLRGNHEDTWARIFVAPNPGFLLHRGNGCFATWRSFAGRPPAHPEASVSDRDLLAMLDVSTWLPAETVDWMATRPAWFEDEHAIYVHAGLDLDPDGDAWLHPSQGREKPLLWSRDPDFYRRYRGKRVVFGHTRTRDLPNDHLGFFRSMIEASDEVWCRGDLVGLDTGAGMGGVLSAISLPDLTVYTSG